MQNWGDGRENNLDSTALKSLSRPILSPPSPVIVSSTFKGNEDTQSFLLAFFPFAFFKF